MQKSRIIFLKVCLLIPGGISGLSIFYFIFNVNIVFKIITINGEKFKFLFLLLIS